MPRYYKYRRYYKRMYPKKKWASNIIQRNTLVTLANSVTAADAHETICLNAPQSGTPTPTLLKFGRLKVKGDIRTDLNSSANYVSGVMYVVYAPQGMTVDNLLIQNHPEYILGWTQISLDSGNSFSFSSALKRNLNSGDSISIVFLVNSVNSVAQTRNFNFYYTVQFWTSSA